MFLPPFTINELLPPLWFSILAVSLIVSPLAAVANALISSASVLAVSSAANTLGTNSAKAATRNNNFFFIFFFSLS